MSIRGGLHKALAKAGGYGFDTCALFVRNQVQWRVPKLPDAAVETFRQTRRQLGLGPLVAHGSYLVNLAGKREIRRKSIRAMIADLGRCGELGVEYLVFHPGSNPDTDVGLTKVAEALDEILDACPDQGAMILLENTAGQGNSLGWRLEQLAEMLARSETSDRLGVCLDTCHLFAAGYDIRTPDGWEETMRQFEAVIGLSRLRAVHMNDSKRALGSRVDRHQHIGRGQIGLDGFAAMVRDSRLQQIPLILETPKGTDEARGRDWDEINAETLRRLHRQKA